MSNRPLTKTEWLASLEELWEAAQQPQKWVGLEIEEVQDSYNSDYQAQTRAIEKLLKERNT
jgi:hypothetical protein